jgi:hypothetical protein
MEYFTAGEKVGMHQQSSSQPQPEMQLSRTCIPILPPAEVFEDVVGFREYDTMQAAQKSIKPRRRHSPNYVISASGNF